jgi:hypothetical protein
MPIETTKPIVISEAVLENEVSTLLNQSSPDRLLEAVAQAIRRQIGYARLNDPKARRVSTLNEWERLATALDSISGMTLCFQPLLTMTQKAKNDAERGLR